MSDETFPTSPKLTSLLSERQFMAAVIVGLPALVFAYVQAYLAITTGADFDATGVTVALGANPITLYLLARQYARGKAVEAVGVQLAPMPAPADPDQLGVNDADVEAAQSAVNVPMQMVGHTEDGRLRFAPMVTVDGAAIADAVGEELERIAADTQAEDAKPLGAIGVCQHRNPEGGTPCIGVADHRGHTHTDSDGRTWVSA